MAQLVADQVLDGAQRGVGRLELAEQDQELAEHRDRSVFVDDAVRPHAGGDLAIGGWRRGRRGERGEHRVGAGVGVQIADESREHGRVFFLTS